ncbi:MAG: ATP-binding cassette domain-containing protein [Candidatus Marinimicrobia bacterium]|nr:ATP-binding cassette domain-containing protein [Candidatus Neomarinimicrobiota bacterium]
MIEIKNLYKAFDERPVFRGLDLTIQEKKITVILGKSGVGKSVLLRHILGLILPDSGEIIHDGRDLTKMEATDRRDYRLQFGMVFQHSALLDSLTVGENVGLGMSKLTDKSDEEIRNEVLEALGAVGLEDTYDMLPDTLSGGMRKRVAFARAIAMQPKYLLYDEPTTGLDPTTGEMITNLILKFAREFETTSIVVTHDMTATLKIADKIALMDDGKIQKTFTPDEFITTDFELARDFLSGAFPESSPVEI